MISKKSPFQIDANPPEKASSPADHFMQYLEAALPVYPPEYSGLQVWK